MAIKINPVNVFRKGIGTSIDVCVSSYKIDGDSVALTWQLLSDEDEVLDSNTEIFGSDIVEQWNASDEILIDNLFKILDLKKSF